MLSNDLGGVLLARSLIRMVFLLAAISRVAYATDAAGVSERANIILVMADDLGWGDVCYNGNAIVQTPCLDAMALEAVRLDRFYAAAPVCSPTRGSCLTGRHPYRYGIEWAGETPLKDEELTLAEVLRDAGYATGQFGKWHVGRLERRPPPLRRAAHGRTTLVRRGHGDGSPGRTTS
jgi:arylsulfatase A-like enzyme